MPKTSGRFTTTPSPTVALGQFWKDKSGTARRVVEPLDEWEVHFARVSDGRRSKVQRVSRNGAPSGGYVFVPNQEPQKDPVHIRMLGKGEAAETYCGEQANGRITTIREHVAWWRERGAEVCRTCSRRASDGVHTVLDGVAA